MSQCVIHLGFPYMRTRDCSLESQEQAAHPHSCVTTSGLAFKVWATFPLIHQTPIEWTIPRVDFLPSTTSNHSELASPLIYHQSRLCGAAFVRDQNSYLTTASCETSSIISVVLLHSAKGSGSWLQSPVLPLHLFSRKPWCLSSPRLQQESCQGMFLHFAIHELAVTTLLQSQKIC